MAGTIPGVSPQIPLSGTSTAQGAPNGTQVRERNDAPPQPDTVQPQGTASSESQASSADNQDILQSRISDLLASAEENETEVTRGSIIDVAI